MITLPLASVMITVTLSVTIPEIAIKRMTLLRPKVSEELKKTDRRMQFIGYGIVQL